MSRLAHATYGAPGFAAEKADADKRAQREIADAEHVQALTGCTWTEALRIARGAADAKA